jgi:uncharacterized protein YidB (DUF937 family)
MKDLFDQVAGLFGTPGAQRAGSDPLASAIAGLFGGAGAGSSGGAAFPGMGAGLPGAAAGAGLPSGIGAGLGGLASVGGLMALVQQFQQAGLGQVVQSWISTGPNLPITAEQLGRVLGGDAVSAMTQGGGVARDDLLGQLSQLLPQLVDQLTPDGQLPQDGKLAPQAMQNLSALLGQLGRG